MAPAAALAQSIAPDTTPQGGSVAAGSAAITQAPGSTTINQSSARTVINWQSFNVGNAASVRFNQPSASAIALNRVVSASPSIIAGQINANGQLVLINQSGVVVTKGADINAESLVLATSNISTKDFMAGNMAFSGAPNAGAKIINDGNITVRETGLVGLVAPQVENDGVITARLGQVVLAGASAFTLDLYGDRLISLDVTKAVRAVDVGGVLVPALVTNRGLILADGGKITLTARDADALVTQLIDAGGTIRADSVGPKAGTIAISGVGGDITIAGNLLARGGAAGSQGGDVEALTTGTVSVAPGALIDASGAAGGGVIAIGTDLARASEGQADVAAPRASAVQVAAGARLDADATRSGNAGRVVLLAEARTDFEGLISVQGGPAGGNGGTAEISSGGVINLGGTVHELAAAGHAGQVLLDPATLAITGGSGGDAASFSGAGGTTLGDDGTTGVSTISAASLASLGGTIILEASSLISVGADIGLTSASALSLASLGDITIGAGISLSSGSLDIDASNTLFVGGALDATDISLEGAGAGGMTIAAAVDAGNSLMLQSGGDIDEANGGYISATSFSGGASGDVELGSSLNSVIDLTGFYGSRFELQNAANTTILSALDAGSITLVTPDALDSGAPISAGAGGVALVANALAFGGTGTVTAPADGAVAYAPYTPAGIELTGSNNALAYFSAGTIVLGAADGFAATALIVSGNQSLAGNLQLVANGGIEQSGTLTAGNLAISGSSIELDGLVTTSGVLDLTAPGEIVDAGVLSAATLAFSGAAFGEVTLSGPLTAGLLTGSAALGVALGNLDNDIAALGAITISDGDLFLGDGGFLTVDAPVRAQNIVLKDSGQGIGLEAAGSLLAAGSIALTGNALSALGGAELSAEAVTLAPYSDLGIDLGGTDNNVLFLFQGVLNAAAGVPVLQIGNGGASIAANGAISANVGTLVLDASAISFTSTLDTSGELALAASGGVSESQSGAIIAPTLAALGTIGGALELDGSGNSIASLLGVTAGRVELLDALPLGIAGRFAAGNATLVAPGLSFEGPVDVAGTLALGSSAGINQLNAAQPITAGTLTSDNLTDQGNFIFSDASIASLGAFSLGGGRFELDDGEPLTVAGALRAPVAELDGPSLEIAAPVSITGELSLDASGGIGIAAPLQAGEVDLAQGFSTIAEAPGGTITTPTLSTDGNAIAGLVLGQANAISTLSNVSDAGGTLALNDVIPLTLADTVSAGSVSLTAPTLDFTGTLLAARNLQLATTAGVSEATGAIISTPSLAGSAGGEVALPGTGNSIGSIGNFSAGAGSFALNDAAPLTLAGDITAGGASLTAPSLDFTGTFIITLPQQALQLTTTAGVSESSGAAITAASLTGSNTGGDVELTGNGNRITDLGGFTFGSGRFALADLAALTVAGTLAGGSAALSAPSIALTGAILASNAVTLDAAGGAISETGGTLDTGSLSVTGATVTLTDGANDVATVAGDGGNVTLADQAALSAGDLSVADLALSAPAISFTGDVSAGTLLSLDSPGAITQTGGTLSAGTLASVGAVGATALNQPGNAVATLGGYTTGSFGLVDGTALAVTGTLAAGTAALSADGIALDAPVIVPGVLSLGGSGGVTQNAAISAGTLAGSLGGDAELGDGANSIATLGELSAGGTLSLADATPLAINGAVSAAAADLTADGISLTGSLLTSGATRLASTGGITESASATLAAASLSGTVSGGDAALPGANSIASLGDFSFGSGSFGLSDNVPLTVAGALTGATASLAAPGFTLAGNIAASNALTLASAAGGAGQTSGGIETPDLILETGGSSALAGNANSITSVSGDAGAVALTDAEALRVSDLTAGALLVTAPAIALGSGVDVAGLLALESPGAVTQNAAITAGTLGSGGATLGTVAFTQAGNEIGTLGGFAAISLRLFDSAPLTIAGPVDANALALNAPGMAFSGNVTAGTLALSGAGGISQSGGGISTPYLDIATAGASALTGNANSIANLTGSAGAVALTDQEAVSVSDLSASDLELTAPDIALGSGIDVSDLLALASPGGITQSAPITAGTLGSGGATDGPVNLTDAGNQIGTLGDFAATGGVVLDDGQALNLNGLIQLGGTLTLTDPDSVTQTGGTLTAGGLATSGTGIGGDLSLGQPGNAISSIGDLGLGGNALIEDSTALDLTGTLAIGGGNLSLADTAPILQTSGIISTGLLNASASSLALPDANRIGSIGSILVAGDVFINGAENLTGLLAAGNATLTSTGAFNLNGTADITGGLTILADGDVTQTGGVLRAGTLSGSAGGLASFGGTGAVADIATLGSFSLADSLFELTDGEALTLIGPVVANTVRIDATGALLLDGSAGGGLFITGGLTPAGATLPASATQSELAVLPDATGASSISAAGTFDIDSVQNAAATIFLATAPNGGGGGNMAFGALQAPGADVILAAGTEGSVTGNVNAAQLEILSAKSVNLTGLINGVGGGPAAALVSSVPGPSPVYLYNSCPIAVANCGIQAVQATATTVTAENPVNKLFTPILTANPLENFDISQRKRRRLNKDVQLPGVATHDF